MSGKRAAGTSEAQRTQQKLVEAALKQPGVADASAIYEGARRFVPQPSGPAPSTRSYGTGGNAR